MDTNDLEKIFREEKLHRQLDALIVAYLRDKNLTQAAIAVASSTMTPLNVDVPPNKLLELYVKGAAADNENMFRGSFNSYEKSTIPLPKTIALDFSGSHSTAGSSKIFPKHESKMISEHKHDVRCARFSRDGRFLATGSADKSIKVFEVSKLKLMAQPDAPVRPATRSFNDHNQPINDVDFHPQNLILVSGSKDCTIKIFDFSKASTKTATKVIQDTHNVGSVAFHPSGDYILAGTDHSIPHLYDSNTLQCYVSGTSELGFTAAINQIRYSATGHMYATASKDGSVRLWDGVTSECVRCLKGAHATSEATSVAFTKDQRYLLSCGKDSTSKVWDVGSGKLLKQYVGATRTQLRSPAVFNHTEEFVLSIDEVNNEVVVWDALSADKVARWPTCHVGSPRCLEHSPVEPLFATCGADKTIRVWKIN